MKSTMIPALMLSFAVSSFGQRGGVIGGGPRPGPGARGPVATVSPWPLYPANGAVPPEFADRHVFLDAQGDALIVLTDENGKKTIFRRELENHVAPEVHSAVAKDSSGAFTYEYSFENRGNARQRVNSFSIAVPALDVVQATAMPDNWGASKVAIQPSRLNWFAKYDGTAVSKGSAAFGFKATSTYKPGLTFAYFTGLAVGEGLPPGPPKADFELPDAVQTEMAPIGHIEFNSVAKLTIGPKFSSTTSRGEIAADFHVGISRLVNRGDLDSQSRWVTETLTQLASFIDSTANGMNAQIAIRQQPSTPLEREISNALKLSLNVP